MSQSRDSRGISLHGVHSSDDSDNSDNPDNPLSPLNSPPRASSSPPPSLASSVDKYEECEEATDLDSITYSLYSYAAMVAPVTAAMFLSRYVRIFIGNWTSLKQARIPSITRSHTNNAAPTTISNINNTTFHATCIARRPPPPQSSNNLHQHPVLLKDCVLLLRLRLPGLLD